MADDSIVTAILSKMYWEKNYFGEIKLGKNSKLWFMLRVALHLLVNMQTNGRVTNKYFREDARHLKLNIYHVTYYCILEKHGKTWRNFIVENFTPLILHN